MAGMVSDESGVGVHAEEASSEQCYQSGEAVAEWRSSGQVENGTPSTSPSYWDCDDDDDGPKPSELYGTHTWKIEKFSQIKRELRSSAFEIGGYKWYILIYPQGCDVCNHLSLFLCVANHDKLLPGWSHFAQFTIAVMHKDQKKTKYSDTLHRFWKKEHDWGWKKFMELSKVFEGFVQDDNLTIMAQVQVIRERADRPFRCLDSQYRRELLRVYLTNVEQICRRFVEERRSKLGKLIEDKSRWSSFRSFWSGVDQNTRCQMSREKADAILKVVVKQFFIEKEVTSTLVMDSLYSGLKALEGHNKNRREKLLDSEETPAPIFRFENDMFVLVDDIVSLLERAAMEPLPPKDDKGPQNRKDGNSGEEVNKDSTERDERRLTELGRRTVEIFVFAHIFSNKIEVAYQEAVALKRQEELIREEEAACLAESGQKAKRGMSEKDKKSKKKQAKQKRNNRKGKEKGKEPKPDFTLQNKHSQKDASHGKKDFVLEQANEVLEKPDIPDAVSDVSDSVECVTEVLQPDSEDRDASLAYSDTDTSEVHPPTEASGSISGPSSVQNGTAGKKSSSVIDDSSSTCSTDSIPSVVMNGPYKGKSSVYKNQKSPIRGKNRRGKMAYGGSSSSTEMDNQPSGPVIDAGDPNDVSGSSKGAESESEAAVSPQKLVKCIEPTKEAPLLQRTLSTRGPVDEDSRDEKAIIPSPPRSPTRIVSTNVQLRPDLKTTANTEPIAVTKVSQNSPKQIDRNLSNPETQKVTTPKSPEKSAVHTNPAMSRPTSAPVVPAPRPTIPMVSLVQTSPLLARSVSAAGRLGHDHSTAPQTRVPQSYKSAIMGNSFAPSSSAHPSSPSSGVNSVRVPPQSSSMVSAPMFVRQRTERIDSNAVQTGFPYGVVAHEPLQNGSPWMQSSESDANRSVHSDQFLSINNIQNRYNQENFSGFSACTSGRQGQAVLADEFPHLDIINDLLDDEQVAGIDTRDGTVFQSHSNSGQLHNRHYSFPGEVGVLGDVVPATSSCRFEPVQSYHDDGFQREYSSLGGIFDSRDYIPQAAAGLPYANGQIDGVIPNQWQMAGSDISLYGMNYMEPDVYPYNLDYSNVACSVNGYTLFRPSSGH